MARVTVIIAARDAASTLPETLVSLTAQTYGDWEAIVVDDASDDGTPEIAAAHDERIRVLHHESPLGPAASRNDGVRAARTELIATLDADDLWTPGYLAAQVAAFDRALAVGQRVGVVCTDAALIDEAGRPCGRWGERIPQPPAPTLEDLLRENFVYNSVLMRREVFLAHGGYPVELLRGEDYDLWLRIVEGGDEIVVNAEPLAVYRLRTTALSADAVQLSAGTRLVLERALDRGRLTRRQRAIARRKIRLYALLERRARLAGRPRSDPAAIAGRIGLATASVRVALEHPERWTAWLRRGPRRAAAGRHA